MTQEQTVETVARQVAEAVQAGQWATALAAIERGETDYPDVTLPKGATWAKLRKLVEGRIAAETPAQEQTVEPPAAETPAQETAPEKAQLHIVHTVDNGTIITGIKRGDGTRDVIGKPGQGWSWNRAEDQRYLSQSRGFAANMVRIECAALALRAAGWPVEIDIDNVDVETEQVASERPLTDYMRGRLADCRAHAVGLAHAAGIPLGNLPGVPVAETVAAPVAKPVAKAASKPATAPAQETAPAQQTARPLAGLALDTLIALVKANDTDAIAEIMHRTTMSAAPAAPVQRKAPARKAAPAPAPETVQETVQETAPVADGPLVFKVALTEDANGRKTASEARTRLNARLSQSYARYGVEIQVWHDKDERSLRVTVTLAGASVVTRERVAKKISNVTLNVRGVAGEFVPATV